MAFKMTLWALALMFLATIYNVVDAYSAMGSMDVQNKFQTIGLLDDGRGDMPLPQKKPLQISEMAAN